MFVYFCRGLSGNMEERPTRRVYIEILTCRAIFYHLEDSRSHGNEWEAERAEPLQRGKTPGRLGMMVKSTPLLKKTEARKLRSYENSRQSLTRTASALSCLSRSSSRTCLTRRAEVSADELERYTNRSLETQSQSSPSAVSLEQARTSWQQQCSCKTCRSRQTPKLDAFETRCRHYSRWRQFNRPKAQLLDVEEPPLKNAMSQHKTKRRYRSISSHLLEVERPRSFSCQRSASARRAT